MIFNTSDRDSQTMCAYRTKPKDFLIKYSTEDPTFLMFGICYFRSAVVLTMCTIIVKPFLIWWYRLKI